jgi:hypothetical protein
MAAYLAGRLKPVERPEPRWLAQQIADLGSDEFATRQKAEQTLDRIVDVAQTALHQAHARAQDLEQRRRLERLLAKLNRPSPERLAQHRAVLALEVRSTPAARQLLGRLARGMPGAGLTEEAKAALGRL